jgi:hypothetical protein
MFCPRCGQERISTETSFCSRCGFLLSGTLELMMTGGVNPNLPAETRAKGQSPRSRGIKQGLFIFLLTFLIVPIVAIITVAMNVQPYGVVIASILFAVGGLLRMAYALMFEASGETAGTGSTTAAIKQGLAERMSGPRELSSPQSEPIPTYMSPGAGKWKDTNELEPASVTDGTTQLLENKELDQ